MCDNNGKCYMIINFIISILSILACLVFNILSFKYKPYNDESYKNLIKNWKSPPITSISLKNNYLDNQIDSINENTFSNLLNLEHMDESYDYEYLLRADLSDLNYHPCGIDSLGNSLYLPNDIECPINEIEITQYPFPSKSYLRYTTINIYNGIYLHYTNTNRNGYLINDLKVNISNVRSWQENYYLNNENKINKFSISLGNKMLDFIFSTYQSYPAVYDTGYEKRNLTEIYFITHAKSFRIAVNIVTIFIFIIIFIFTILVLAKDNLLGLHIFNIILIILAFSLQFMVLYYLDYNKMIGERNAIFFGVFFEKGNDWNIMVLIFIIGYLLTYPRFFAIRSNNNMYFFLVYIVRYKFNCAIFGCCIRNKKEKIRKEINELDRDIEELNNKLKELKTEESEIIKTNQTNLKLIKKYKEILENKKRNVSNNVEVNIHIEEKIEIEKKIKYFENTHKDEVDNFNSLKNQINEIEKEINFYKLKNLKF